MEEQKLTLNPNVPVQVSLTEIAVTPDGGYGPGVAFKGINNKVRVTGFFKGKAWAALKELKRAQVIKDEKYDEEPQKRYTIPLIPGNHEVVIEMQKRGDAKYAELKITQLDAVDKMEGEAQAVGEAKDLAGVTEIKYPKADVEDMKEVFKNLGNVWVAGFQTAVRVKTFLAEKEEEAHGIDCQTLATSLFIEYNKILSRR